MRHILLTGASGFLGTHVLAALHRHGYVIHAVDRRSIPGTDTNGVTWHVTDLLDRFATRNLFEEVCPYGLIHLAWETTHGIYWNSPENLEWLASSIGMVKDFSYFGGKRLLIAGSSAEYLWGGLDDMEEIISPMIPASLYGASKNALREVIEKWAPICNISWSWPRFFNLFGPNDNPLRLLPRVIQTLINGQNLSFDSGSLRRDFLHVADAGDAVAALFHSEIQGPVNIASGEALSIRDVISTIAEYLHASDRVKYNSEIDLSNQPEHIVADINRLRQIVGWQPKKSFEARLFETCNWWLQAQNE